MRLLFAVVVSSVLFLGCGTRTHPCEANSCGACPAGCTSSAMCLDGQWRCGCDCPDGGGCGPNPCGACPTACTVKDVCSNGTWNCQCACP